MILPSYISYRIYISIF